MRDDVRCALRALRRSPGYTLSVGVALAIGIGANTALFSVVSAVLLKPLPYPESARLVALHETVDKFHIASAPLSTIEFGALCANAESCQAIGAYENIDGELSTEREAETLHGLKMTASAFDVLGVPALIGRVFTAEEDFDGSDGMVISQRLWRNRFGADPAITSRRVLIDRKPRTILSVMPAGFVFPLSLARRSDRSFGQTSARRLIIGSTLAASLTKLSVSARRIKSNGLHPSRHGLPAHGVSQRSGSASDSRRCASTRTAPLSSQRIRRTFPVTSVRSDSTVKLIL